MKRKYTFWVKSSRMTDIKEDVETDFEEDGYEEITEGLIKDYLESWCEEVFPMFNYTDAYVDYGYIPVE
jgi:hypothetical protein